MLDDAADVEKRHFRQTSVLVTGELVVAIFPERLVNVHTRTVITDQRLRHKGGRFAIRVGHVVDHVLHFLNFVSFLHQRVELNADFVLTCVGNLVVVYLDGLTNRFQGITHCATNIVEAIDRRNREVAAFNARAVAKVAAFNDTVGCPSAFVGGDFVHGALDIRLPMHFVKNKEFRLRTEERGVAQASRLQVSFCALSDRARVTIIALHSGRLDDVTAQHQRRIFGEGVKVARTIFRAQNHVGFVNALPTFNRRAIEHLAILEEFFVYIARRHGHVLFFTASVGETQVYPFNIVFFN